MNSTFPVHLAGYRSDLEVAVVRYHTVWCLLSKKTRSWRVHYNSLDSPMLVNGQSGAPLGATLVSV
jgi:hypothetical protein